LIVVPNKVALKSHFHRTVTRTDLSKPSHNCGAHFAPLSYPWISPAGTLLLPLLHCILTKGSFKVNCNRQLVSSRMDCLSHMILPNATKAGYKSLRKKSSTLLGFETRLCKIESAIKWIFIKYTFGPDNIFGQLCQRRRQYDFHILEKISARDSTGTLSNQPRGLFNIKTFIIRTFASSGSQSLCSYHSEETGAISTQ
jgi:hypothetical protein